MINFAISALVSFDTAAMNRALTNKRKTLVKEAAQLVLVEAKRVMSKKVQREDGGGKSRSRPGELPRSDSGSYRKSLKRVVKGAIAFVGTKRPEGSHAPILKWGTKYMEKRAVASEVALANVRARLTSKFSGIL